MQKRNVMKKYLSYLRKIWNQPSKGFGDTFAKITKSFGIKPCPKCEKRRKDWNEKIKYRRKSSSEEEIS